MKKRKEKEYDLDTVTPDFIFTEKKISPVLYFIHSSYFSVCWHLQMVWCSGWCWPITSEFWRLRKTEGLKFEAKLDYKARACFRKPNPTLPQQIKPPKLNHLSKNWSASLPNKTRGILNINKKTLFCEIGSSGCQ